jgi:hypothetical protein
LLISEFTRTLLEHFIKQIECPSCLAMDSVNGSNGDSGSLYKIGQSVASMFCKVSWGDNEHRLWDIFKHEITSSPRYILIRLESIKHDSTYARNSVLSRGLPSRKSSSSRGHDAKNFLIPAPSPKYEIWIKHCRENKNYRFGWFHSSVSNKIIIT